MCLSLACYDHMIFSWINNSLIKSVIKSCPDECSATAGWISTNAHGTPLVSSADDVMVKCLFLEFWPFNNKNKYINPVSIVRTNSQQLLVEFSRTFCINGRLTYH